MGKTIKNVLVGVAVLEVGTPDSRGEFSTEIVKSGKTYAAKLSKAGPDVGAYYGSTGVEFKPTLAQSALKISHLVALANTWGWWHYYDDRMVVNTYKEMGEYYFEDPNSEAWVAVGTQQLAIGEAGTQAWNVNALSSGDMCGINGWSPGVGAFSDWSLKALSALVSTIQDKATDISNAADWVLKRVRIELYESSPARSVYIDDVYLEGQAYSMEPGQAAGAGTPKDLTFTGPFVEVGYTEDGVSVAHTTDTTDIEVEEETYAIANFITKENTEVTCNMAESSLQNLAIAMGGAAFVPGQHIITLGAGVQKPISLKITGLTPAGFVRVIQIPKAVAVGSVGMSYRRAEKTIVPVTFRALKDTGRPAVTIFDNRV